MRDWTLPGYKYLGPGNSLFKGRPTNEDDLIAFLHDLGYDHLIKNVKKNPYWNWNKADEEGLKRWTTKTIGGRLARAFFKTKRAAAKVGLIGTIPDEVPTDAPTPAAMPRATLPPLKKYKNDKNNGPLVTSGLNWLHAQEQADEDRNARRESKVNSRGQTQVAVTSVIQGASNMPEGAGSGNDQGLKETPVDEVMNASRGPPDYSFATLPYILTYRIDTKKNAQDEVFRMTSPYDCKVQRNNDADLNAGAGATTIGTVSSDAADDDISKARWYDFYGSLYKYYHVVATRWHLTVENLSTEACWLHQMYYTETLPPWNATNNDMLLWNDCHSYRIGPIGYAITSDGTAETNEMQVEEADDEDNAVTVSDANYETGNMVTHGTNFIKISGKYRTGQARREIRQDSEVENWTAVTTNPTLPEKLLLRFKPDTNSLLTNSADSSNSVLNLRYHLQIECG